MHPRREPLCGSVRRFPVPVGSSERVAYKGVQCAEMLRNVEVFKKLLLIFELQDFWTILSDSFSGFSEK